MVVGLLVSLSLINTVFAGPEAAPAAGAQTPFRPLMIEFAENGVTVATPVVVSVQADGQPAVEAELADDGLMPDETAKDGVYSGAMWFSGASATVSARMGEQTLSAGSVAIPGALGPRFLRMETVDGTLQVSAFSPTDTTPVGARADTLPEMSGGAGAVGRPPPGEPPSAGGGGSSIRSVIIAVVAGLLGAFGGHALGQRSKA